MIAAGLGCRGGGRASRFAAPHRRRNAALDADSRRIAVPYFDDKSDDHSLGAVADGLTEELIRSLSTAPSLTVITRSGVEPYRGTAVATDSIARALRAGYVVRGEVEQEGDRVRVGVRCTMEAESISSERPSPFRCGASRSCATRWRSLHPT